jgi:beta-mannosidase
MIKRTIILCIFAWGVSFSQAFPEDKLLSPYYSFPRNDSGQISLDDNWELTCTGDTIQSPAQLAGNRWIRVEKPTSVQMAMYKAGEMPDPYYGLNSIAYQPLEQKIWYYKKTFTLPAQAAGKCLILSFDGIDYFAKIWLNGQYLGRHEGMYGGPSIDISRQADFDGENELLVQVLSANYRNPGYRPRRPGRIIKTWFFTGGSGVDLFFHFGMWRGASLKILPEYHLERPFLYTRKIEGKKALLAFQAEVFAGKHSLDYVLHPPGSNLGTYHSPLGTGVPHKLKTDNRFKINLQLAQQGTVCFRKEIHPSLLQGRSWIEDNWEIDHPKLWYPNGTGHPECYEATVQLEVNGRIVDEITFNFGVRTIRQIRSAGLRTGDRWANWQFVINGQAQFIKGMNWMPIDALSHLTPEKYEWLILAAKNLGVQMFRIWGSGYLETGTFYDLCNRHGIMVWQDFPIANFTTPEWPLDVWEAQVCRNIFRLRNEPSLAVWCGGNEFNAYSYATTAVTGVLERNLAEFDPTRLFLRASPDAGSMHAYPDFDPYWYTKYDLIPFVAETGIHCMTDPRGIREVVDGKELFGMGRMADSSFIPLHPQFIHHFVEYEPSRVPRMLSRATHMIDIRTASYEEMVEATQAGAGEFYQVMSESFQANYPVTTGMMPWTYNRPWPTVAAINLIDGFGQPTAPYYFLKRTYEDNHVMLDLPRLLYRAGESIPLKAKVLNLGRDTAYRASIELTGYNQKMEEVYRQTRNVNIQGGDCTVPVDFDDFRIPAQSKNSFFFLTAILKDSDGRQLSQSVYHPRTVPQMEDDAYYARYLAEPTPFPSLNDGPWLKPTVAKNKTTLHVSDIHLSGFDGEQGVVHYAIKNTGKHPAFMTTFEIEGLRRIFYASDNFFWLHPGETKQVTVHFKLREAAKTNELRCSFGAWNAKTVFKNVTIGLISGTRGAFPGAFGEFPGTRGEFPGVLGEFPGTRVPESEISQT